MAEVELPANLTPQHRSIFQQIFIYDDERRVLVEDRPWMPQPETKILYVRVERCTEAALQFVKTKLGRAPPLTTLPELIL